MSSSISFYQNLNISATEVLKVRCMFWNTPTQKQYNGKIVSAETFCKWVVMKFIQSVEERAVWSPSVSGPETWSAWPCYGQVPLPTFIREYRNLRIEALVFGTIMIFFEDSLNSP